MITTIPSTYSSRISCLRPTTRFASKPSPDSRILVRSLSPAPKTMAEEIHGTFRTLAAPTAHEGVTFGWSADIGGQARCRHHGGPGYAIFDVARMEALDFFLFLGDTVYADDIVLRHQCAG